MRSDVITCTCGISCHPWLDGVWICPRCRSLYTRASRHEPLQALRGKAAEALVAEVEALVKGKMAQLCKEKPKPVEWGVKREPSRARGNSAALVPCDMCGSLLEDRCGSKCTNCGWIKPCSIS